jgi:hypothetical protein
MSIPDSNKQHIADKHAKLTAEINAQSSEAKLERKTLPVYQKGVLVALGTVLTLVLYFSYAV